MKKNKPILVLVFAIFFSGFLSNCVLKSKCRDYKYSLVSKKNGIQLRKFLSDCNQPEHYNYKNAFIRLEDLRNPPPKPEPPPPPAPKPEPPPEPKPEPEPKSEQEKKLIRDRKLFEEFNKKYRRSLSYREEFMVSSAENNIRDIENAIRSNDLINSERTKLLKRKLNSIIFGVKTFDDEYESLLLDVEVSDRKILTSRAKANINEIKKLISENKIPDNLHTRSLIEGFYKLIEDSKEAERRIVEREKARVEREKARIEREKARVEREKARRGYAEFTEEDLELIIKAGETNEFRFKKKYKGKLFGSESYFVTLKQDSSSNSRWVLITEVKSVNEKFIVFCSISEDIAEKAIDFDPGNKMIIVGKIYDVLLESGGRMRSRLKNTQELSLENIDATLERTIAQLSEHSKSSLQLASNGCDIEPVVQKIEKDKTEGLFVSVGYSGTILTSSDGTTWTERNSGTPEYLNRVTYGNGLFVTVGWEGTILTSPDGTTWTQRTSGTPEYFIGVTYRNGLFVTVGGDGTILTSPDGNSWTKRNSGTLEYLRGVTYFQ